MTEKYAANTGKLNAVPPYALTKEKSASVYKPAGGGYDWDDEVEEESDGEEEEEANVWGTAGSDSDGLAGSILGDPSELPEYVPEDYDPDEEDEYLGDGTSVSEAPDQEPISFTLNPDKIGGDEEYSNITTLRGYIKIELTGSVGHLDSGGGLLPVRWNGASTIDYVVAFDDGSPAYHGDLTAIGSETDTSENILVPGGSAFVKVSALTGNPSGIVVTIYS